MTGAVADAVFSGGGVRAIAYAGALAAAEEAGYTEWHELAGTSAGAITAAALAVGYDSRTLTERLRGFDLATVAEVGWPRRVGQLSNLLRHHALAAGHGLLSWIEDLLTEAPRPARTFGELEMTLRVVATDLVHQRMVVFPDDAGRYLDPQGVPWTPEAFPIAEAVRMSAGYPFMFAPWPLVDAASGQPGALVDGGIVSGFPVFLFDSPEPRHPTWGFRLDGEQVGGRSIGGASWPVNLLRALVETSIGVHDSVAAAAFSERTIVIPTGETPTLKFTLAASDKQMLWQSGHDAAQAFFASGPTGQNIYGQRPPAATLPASASASASDSGSGSGSAAVEPTAS